MACGVGIGGTGVGIIASAIVVGVLVFGWVRGECVADVRGVVVVVIRVACVAAVGCLVCIILVWVRLGRAIIIAVGIAVVIAIGEAMAAGGVLWGAVRHVSQGGQL